MLALRNLTRAVPRSILEVSAHCSRRSFSNISRSTVFYPTYQAAGQPQYARFSTSRIAWEKQGQVDQELTAKLESELAVEKEIRDSEQLPASLQDFVDASSFSLKDTPGDEEVVLTRQFGDEKIRIAFSIADLNAVDQDPDVYNDDKAQYDEPMEDIVPDTQQGGAQTKGAVNQGRTKDGNFAVAPEDRVEQPVTGPSGLVDDTGTGADQDGSDSEPSFPARLNVIIEKSNKGALQVEAIAQDGEIVIENVSYFNNADLADAKTAELDYSKRNLYSGPPFGNLDEELQVLLERYLDERGINTGLALWVPEYIDFKEQREYLNWLNNVKSFVDA